MLNLTYKSFTIAANTTVPLHVTGTKVICAESSARFYVKVDNGEKIPLEVGLAIHANEPFTRLNFSNDTAADITCAVYVGDANVDDKRLNTLISRTIIVGMQTAATRIKAREYSSAPGVTGGPIADGSGIDCDGTDEYGNRRKQITVANLTTGNLDLRKKSTSAASFGVVLPNQVWTMETSANVCVFNSSGAPADGVRIMETFYTETPDLTA